MSLGIVGGNLDLLLSLAYKFAQNNQVALLTKRKPYQGVFHKHPEFSDSQVHSQVKVRFVFSGSQILEFLGNYHTLKLQPRSVFVDLTDCEEKDLGEVLAMLKNLNNYLEGSVVALVPNWGDLDKRYYFLSRFFEALVEVDKEIYDYKYENYQVSLEPSQNSQVLECYLALSQLQHFFE